MADPILNTSAGFDLVQFIREFGMTAVVALYLLVFTTKELKNLGKVVSKMCGILIEIAHRFDVKVEDDIDNPEKG